MSVNAPTYRFSVAEYEKLGETGIFHEDDRVELLNGEIIVMSPIGYRHAATVRNLTEIFVEASKRRYSLDPQNPFVLNDESQPQPDITLFRRDVHRAKRLPAATDIHLVIEVSDSSLGYDRNDKLPAYARNGIVEVWIVNLVNDTVEVYRDPNPAGYETKLRFTRDDTLSPLAFSDIEVRVSEVLP
jgi:Uma2 family endonuclease